MVKILYAVAGEGMGHAIRAKPILDELTKKHEVIIISDNGAHKYLAKHFDNVEFMPTLHIKYRKNKVVMWGTLFKNLNNLPKLFKNLGTIKKIYNKWKPDILINDFTLIPNYLALWHNIPIITIDNQHMITSSKREIPKGSLIDFFKSWAIIKLFVPKANFHIITGFFFPQTKKKNLVMLHQPIRKELLKHKPSTKDHVLVYQTSQSNQELFSLLKQLPEQFIIHGQGKTGKEDNLYFKPFEEEGFFKDLASCKAVINNGSFSLLNEALYLKKPVLAIPVSHQFEQILNSHYLQKFGWGMAIPKNNLKSIQYFLQNLQSFNPKSQKPNTPHFMRIVEDKISQLTA